MNSSLVLEGGKALNGEIALLGAKNTLPKNMVAALLSDETSRLENVAEIEDVAIMSKVIGLLGGTVKPSGPRALEISAGRLKLPRARDLLKFSGTSRIPVLLCGPMLARLGRAIVPLPGGCQIGPRPIDFHLKALEQLGATVKETRDGYLLEASKLRGTKITLDYPSVGATEQVLLSSVMAEGITELRHAAVEPEIIDLIAILQKMGAIISVETDRVIRILGVEKLHGFNHQALPDRLEAGSWACAAVATKGKIFVRHARQLDMITFLNKFRQIGGEFTVDRAGITFFRAGSDLKSNSLETDVHPGFMTDWQQPFVVALTQAQGASIVHETVYENRFGYVEALNRMGAQIQLYPECLGAISCRFQQANHLHSAVIAGPTPLRGAEITIPDLRAGFSYVIAACAAEGASKINNFAVLNRGYENLTQKLTTLGASIG